MPTTYQCPFCRKAIAVDDVNVATDIALCRACGKTSSFAMISSGTALTLDATQPPPRGVTVTTDFRGGTRITYRRLSPALLFLVPFTAFWSGLSMWGIYGTQFRKGHLEIGQSLFGLPFLAGTIVLVSIITFLLLGKWVITLEQGTGSVFTGVGALGWTRRFTYSRTSLVSLRMTNFRINNVPQEAILVRTDGKDFMFGASLKADAKRFLAASIMAAATKA